MNYQSKKEKKSLKGWFKEHPKIKKLSILLLIVGFVGTKLDDAIRLKEEITEKESWIVEIARKMMSFIGNMETVVQVMLVVVVALVIIICCAIICNCIYKCNRDFYNTIMGMAEKTDIRKTKFGGKRKESIIKFENKTKKKKKRKKKKYRKDV